MGVNSVQNDGMDREINGGYTTEGYAPPQERYSATKDSFTIGEVVERLRPEFPALSVSKIRYLERSDERFGLILCDPPYRLADRLAAELDPLIRRVLATGGRVVVETSPGSPLDIDLPIAVERSYGDTLIRVHTAAGGE